MSAILISSVVLRAFALLGTLWLTVRLRDIRLVVLAVMIALMCLRQTWTMLLNWQNSSLSFSANIDELPGLAVSALALLSVFFIGRIVREQRAAVVALKQRERESAEAQRMAKLGHWLWDNAESKWIQCSEEIPRMFLAPEKDLLGDDEKFMRFVHPDDQDFLRRRTERLQSHPERYESEYRIVRGDGEVRYFFEIGEPVFDTQGRLIQFRGTTQDITERKTIEQALQASEKRYRELVEGSRQGLIIQRGETLLFANRAASKIFGFDDVEALLAEDSLAPLVGKELIDAWNGLLDGEATDQGPEDNFEFEARRKDGKTIWLQNSLSVVDWMGEPAIQSTLIDVTERKRAEQALKASETRFREFAEAASDWFWECDSEMQFTYVSPGLKTHTGLDPETYIGKTRETAPGRVEASPKDMARQMEAIAERRPFRDFLLCRHLDDGRKIHIRTSGHPIFDESGQFLGYRGVASNVSKEHKAELERQRAEIRLARAIETIPLAFAYYDPEDRLVICNKRYRDGARTAGLYLTPGDHFGDLMNQFMEKGGLLGDEAQRTIWQQRRLGRRQEPVLAFEFRRLNGSWEQVSDYVLDDGSVITISTDITERKAAEESAAHSEARLRQTQDELLRVSRISVMGQISSAIAHELNQPLTAIRNYMQAGRRFLPAAPAASLEDANEYFEKADRQVERAAAIIRGLRSFVERRRSHRSPQCINEVIKEAGVLALIGAKREGVDVTWKLSDDSARVMMDKVQIEQVIINLVRNGIDAMADAKNRELVLETKQGSDGSVEVAVSDSGVGLSKHIQRRLFQPFVTDKPEGLGIGLSISQSIITAHGGVLWANGRPGGGTTFRFSLPVIEAA